MKGRTCYYADDIKGVINIDFSHIFLNKKLYENILIDDISCKTFMDAKPLCIRFDEIHGFIKKYDGIRYLVLFGP